MFRVLLIGLVLAGCSNPAAEMANVADEIAHQCRASYNPQTEAAKYNECMFGAQQMSNRAVIQSNVQAQRAAAVQGAIGNMQRHMAAQEPVRMAPRTCTSSAGAFGTVVTNCQ
jgi:hypothetical protein